MAEVEFGTLVAGFRAVVAEEIGKHRQQNARDTLAFERDVEAHQKRYGKKLEGICNKGDKATHAAADACAEKIAKIARAEIERVRGLGCVEF